MSVERSVAVHAEVSRAAPLFVDTHCHLDAPEFASDRDAVVAAAQAAGVARIVIPAVEIANFSAVRDCCLRYPVCQPAYGIHPLYVSRATDNDLDALRDYLRVELDGPQPPIAVGEIGLDFFVPGFDVLRQTHFFVEQLKIAREFGLPVLLHVRRSQDAILKELRRFVAGAASHGGIAHAFNGSRQQAEAFIGLGFKLGFGGAMTFSRALRIRDLASTLPAAAIVIETDAPDIPPEFIGRSRNSPHFLPQIAEHLAELRGVSVEEIARVTAFNARCVLPGLA